MNDRHPGAHGPVPSAFRAMTYRVLATATPAHRTIVSRPRHHCQPGIASSTEHFVLFGNDHRVRPPRARTSPGEHDDDWCP